jgi:dTDP-glucose pyrophosphorylase
MYYVICMAGESTRFKQQGILQPKYTLNVGNRSMFSRALGSLPILPEDTLLFMVHPGHFKTFGVEEFIHHEIQGLGVQVRLKTIPVPRTQGQLETALYAQNSVDNEGQLAIYNIDTAFVSSTLRARFRGSLPRLDGVLGGFPADGQMIWSFAMTQLKDGEQVVLRTSEKSPLPGYALTGLYHFSKAESFFSAASEELQEPLQEKGEYYIAPIYNRLIAKGMEFVVDVVNSITDMGTPEHLKQANVFYGASHGE